MKIELFGFYNLPSFGPKIGDLENLNGPARPQNKSKMRGREVSLHVGWVLKLCKAA
jgi:hypothetical protein